MGSDASGSARDPGQQPDRLRPGERLRAVRRHGAAIAVFLFLLIASAVVTIGVDRVVDDQEQRLLDERATEVAAFLTTTVDDTRSALYAAGSVGADAGATPTLFDSLSASLRQGNGTVVVARPDGAAMRVDAVSGAGVRPGSVVPDAEAAVARRALAGRDVVADLVTEDGVTRLIFAIRVGGDRPAVAFLRSAPITGQPARPSSNSAYRELDVALYASETADPTRVLLASGGVPGDRAERRWLTVGADRWLIALSPARPLVGSLAANFRWIVLAGGLLVTALMTALIAVLSRRREYALKLVEQRTRALARAQAEAEAANRSKSEFLSRMSHELRTPLNAVLGFGQLLELDDLTDDQRQSVTQITRGGRHLLDLINEVLDITRIETGQLSLSPEPVLVAELVADVADLLRPLAEDRAVHLIGADARVCRHYVFADRQRVKQVLLNLVGNGIKYNRQGGSVSISCVVPEDGRLRIKVTDTGPGIPREQFDLLFTPFERLGAEQTSVEGTGIGLALSKRLAEAMGGTLGVESTVGRGSTFWVEFPVVEGPLDRMVRLEGPSATPGAPAAGARPAVLHIEDNLANIALIERVIAQRPGLTLIPAMQGRLGVELARQHRPVLILLDLNLADVPGEDVLRQLLEDPLTAGIPVVVVSADAMPRQVQRLLSTGASAYLTKPFDVRELLDLVDRAVLMRRASLAHDEPQPAATAGSTAGPTVVSTAGAPDGSGD